MLLIKNPITSNKHFIILIVNSDNKNSLSKFKNETYLSFTWSGELFETLYFHNRCKDLAYVIRDLRKTTLLPNLLRDFNGLVKLKYY